MPALGSIIAGVLLWIAGNLVARVLVSLGVMAVAFVGLDTLLTTCETYIISTIQVLPPDLIAIAKIMKLGVSLKLLLSAASMRLTLQGLTEGSITKMFVGVRSIS